MTHEAISAEVISQEEVERRAVVELGRKDPRVHEGELEIDDNAIVSFGADNGAYVQAWLWVDFNGTCLDDEAEHESEEISAR